MKKNILAALVTATAFMSLPTLAAGNTAQVVIHGSVFDDTESCNVTPMGAIASNTVVLDDMKANELEKLAVNTPSLAYAKDVIYKIQDCKTGGKDFNGDLTVSMSGNYNTAMDNVLLNDVATGAAGNAAITVMNYDNSRIKLDGSNNQKVAFKPGTPTIVKYKTTYVKTANNVTPGSIVGSSVFTISY